MRNSKVMPEYGWISVRNYEVCSNHFVRFGEPQTVDPIIESLIEKASFRLWLAYY